jgi:hypothetical protein
MPYAKEVITVNITDPGADKNVPLFRVPDGETYTIEAAHACPDTTTAAATDNYYQVALMNGGTAGTGTTVISGTAGGTVGWTANTPKELSITSGSGDLTEGQWAVAKYDEEGTVAPGRITISLTVVKGIGAKA